MHRPDDPTLATTPDGSAPEGSTSDSAKETPPTGERTVSRRAMIAGSAIAIGGALLHTAAEALSQVPQVPGSIGPPGGPDPTRVQGALASPRGSRAPEVKLARRPVARGQVSFAPIQDFEGIMTPSDLHYERHHAGIPTIDPDRYRLLIHGMVERPMSYSLADLKRFPRHSHIGFVECSGNGGGAFRTKNPKTSPQMLDGLFSTSEWIGVPLSTLLHEVGADPKSTWILAEGSDAALMSRSIPMEKAMDDALVAFGQNGEPLRPPQGYPVRLILPGWEGNTQVKWLRRLKLGDRPWMVRDETDEYTDPMKNGTALMFTMLMHPKSIITFPSYPAVLPEQGWWEVSGLAWSGKGKVAKVEVSSDGGDTWEEATLQEPVLPRCGTRFRHLWKWDGSPALLQSRTTDETGEVQPTYEEFLDRRGPGTLFHYNHIVGWRVDAGGNVTYDARAT